MRLEAKIKEIRNFSDSEIRIATIAAGAVGVAPLALAELNSKLGPVRSNLLLRSHVKTIDLISSGRADVGLCNQVGSTVHVKIRETWKLECLLAMPCGHVLAQRDVVTLEDIHDQPLISTGENFSNQYVVDPKVRDILNAQTRRKTNLSFPAIMHVTHGLGLALVDPLTAAISKNFNIEIRPFAPKIIYPLTIIETLAATPTRLTDHYIELLRDGINNIVQ